MEDEEYTLDQFTNVSKFTGGYNECMNYIKANGGMLYTQVDCDEYTDNDGTKATTRYVKGSRWVNRTGWYGVV